jgi:hypothetical protein
MANGWSAAHVSEQLLRHLRRDPDPLSLSRAGVDMCPELVEWRRFVIKGLFPAVGVWRRPRRRQGHAPSGGLRPALTPTPGDAGELVAGSRRGVQDIRGNV